MHESLAHYGVPRNGTLGEAPSLQHVPPHGNLTHFKRIVTADAAQTSRGAHSWSRPNKSGTPPTMIRDQAGPHTYGRERGTNRACKKSSGRWQIKKLRMQKHSKH